MWDLPGPGLEPMSPALAGRFLTTAPPGKSRYSTLHVLGASTAPNSYLCLFNSAFSLSLLFVLGLLLCRGQEIVLGLEPHSTWGSPDVLPSLRGCNPELATTMLYSIFLRYFVPLYLFTAEWQV